MHPLMKLMKHCSSFYRLQKAVAWLLRLRSYIYLKRQGHMEGPISVPEMTYAETVIVRFVQGQTYPQEVRLLRQGNQIPKSSPIYKLNPVLDNDLLVLSGRLRHACLSRRSKHPVILPRSHRISHIIISDCHNEAHLGTEWTLCRLRSKYWIVGARNMIKSVKRECVLCKKLYAPPLVQRMADLPPERCLPGKPPFAYLFGPFYVKLGRAEVKRYGVIFSCFTTREKLHSLEPDTFINGFIRFIARRGYPLKLWSENGTNLVGAYTELSKSIRQLDRNKIVQVARRHNVDWTFNPPFASHQGGIWERMIRTVRKILLAIVNVKSTMTDDILETVFCEVENIINSRPITKVSADCNEPDPLTPNHLFLLAANDSLPWGTFHDSDTENIGDMYNML